MFCSLSRTACLQLPVTFVWCCCTDSNDCKCQITRQEAESVQSFQLDFKRCFFKGLSLKHEEVHSCVNWVPFEIDVNKVVLIIFSHKRLRNHHILQKFFLLCPLDMKTVKDEFLWGWTTSVDVNMIKICFCVHVMAFHCFLSPAPLCFTWFS